MRKLLLLFLTAAVFTGAFASSSASASVLCSVNESGCPAENTIEQGETFWIGGLATLETSIGNLTCVTGAAPKVTDAGGEGKGVEIQATFSFSQCKSGGGLHCFKSTTKAPSNVTVQGTGGNGTMTVAALSVEFQCFSPAFQCTLSTGEFELAIVGGKPMIASAENIVLSGPSCPSASLSLQYESLLPASLFVVDGPLPEPVTRLCRENTSPCPALSAAKRYAIGTTIEASLEGNSTFEFLYEGKLREPACEGSTLTAKTTEAGKPLIGEVSALAFSKCGAGVCAVEAQSLAYKAEIEKTSGGNGALSLAEGGGGSPKIEVNCGAAFKCTYKATGVSFAITGGNPAQLAVSQTLEKDAASEAECGSSMTWTATYKLTKPSGSLFVTS